MLRNNNEINIEDLSNQAITMYHSTNPEKTSFIITGASATGKTTLVDKAMLNGYNHLATKYSSQRFNPLMSEDGDNPEILIATSNHSKFKDFNLYLKDEYDVIQSTSLDINLTIPEGMDSIEDNAIAKARAWSIATGKIAIGDDTGFFINELHGEPGVALRRWGGELPDDTTGEEFWSYLQSKTDNLDSLDCYFKQCVAVASPNGMVKIVYSKNEGVLNRDKLQQPYNRTGYPLAAAFESHNRHKTWDEMTDIEKIKFDQPLIKSIKSAITEVRLLEVSVSSQVPLLIIWLIVLRITKISPTTDFAVITPVNPEEVLVFSPSYS